MGSLCSKVLGRKKESILLQEDKVEDTLPVYSEEVLREMFQKYNYEHTPEMITLGVIPVHDIWDEFDKGDVLGKGGYGEVVIVTRKEDPSVKYAMKSLDKRRKEKDTFAAFSNEVEIHRLVNHVHVVRFNGSYVSKDFYHIVTELCNGGEMFDRIVTEKRFSESVASHFIKQILEGLSECHAKDIVHRDLKPSNFVFSSFQANEKNLMSLQVKLIDFGLAKHVNSKSYTIYSDKVGTPYYVSPETIDMNHPYYYERTAQILMTADMWAIGAIVFVLITGKLPFPGRKHRDIFRNIARGKWRFPSDLLISDTVKDFIRSLLQMDPLRRLTCKQALAHPWITNRPEDVPRTPIDVTVLNELHHFQRQNHLRKAVAHIAVNYLTEGDIRMLQDLFATYDTDKSGNLEITELISMLVDNGYDPEDAREEAQLMLQDLDLDHDGGLSIKEFAQTFDEIDRNKDGRITAREFRESIVGGKGGVPGFYGDIGAMFREADTDGDGSLTFNEFLDAMTQTLRISKKANRAKADSAFT